jgi:hypothetical protein
MVLFAARGLRPAVIVGAAYAALTVAAAAFQSPGTIALVRRIAGAAAALGSRAGESNLHSLLAWLGRPEWMAAASIAVFLLLGLWVWRQRDGDWWLLMAVCAIAARFWTYHRWYDDLLLLLPMIALYCAASGGTSRWNLDVAAGVLLALTLAVMIAPGGRCLLPAPWDAAWGALQVAIWIADLALLLAIASAAGPGGRGHSVGVPPGA